MQNISLWFESLKSGIIEWALDFKADFIMCFISSDRWLSIVKGLWSTIQITFIALMIGIAIGIVVAAVRSTWDKNAEAMAKNGGFGYFILKLFNGICHIYLTVIRGTPVVVQLMIFYFIIFATSRNGLMVAAIAFGINSGAYVAEIFRGGILSIDNGQFEAGRSLGFNYIQTMFYIILPQVFKTILPTLCNEFIVLIKETSVAGYVGVMDLTKAGDIIRGRTFIAFMPLIAVALIYLVLVMVLTYFVRLLERRLRKNER